MTGSWVNPFRVDRVNGPFDQGYRRDWDVASVGREFTEWLGPTIDGLRGRTTPDPQLPIACLIAPPGYGKTHLFARVAEQRSDDVLFVFVPQVEDPRRPMDHIRWHVVEGLFHSIEGRPQPIRSLLSRASRESFLAYLDALPPSLKAPNRDLQQGLERDAHAALAIVEGVSDLDPFLSFAESVVDQHPEQDGQVIRALALGWSPAGNTARRWLRGESLRESEATALRLGEEAPSARAVVAGAASLMSDTPMVLCCDQAEALLVDEESEGPRHLANALMDLIQNVPRLLVTMSCLDDRWPAFQSATFGAFPDRCRDFTLGMLDPDQAAELVVRRLDDLPGERPSALWPFDEDSIRRGFAETPGAARQLLKDCSRRFDGWVDSGRDGLICLDSSGERVDPSEPIDDAFVAAFESMVSELRADPDVQPGSRPEARLHNGVLELARIVGFAVDDEVLKPTPSRPRYALRIRGGDARVLVGVTRGESGSVVQHYWAAFSKELATGYAGGVIIHAGAELKMGGKTRERVEACRAAGSLRTWSFEDDVESFLRLEALLDLLSAAQSQELRLGEQLVSRERCSELVRASDVVAELPVLRTCLDGWLPADSSASKVSSVEEPAIDPQADPIKPTRVSTAGGHGAGDPMEVWARDRLAEVCEKLRIWNLDVVADGAAVGPTFARLRVRPQGRTTIGRIRNKREDLKIHLGLEVAPFIDSQAGFISVDIQLPERRTVTLADAMRGDSPGAPDDPVFSVGQDVGGGSYWLDLSDSASCHLLVAGTTGSGKSEFLRAMIAGLAARLEPEQLQFALIDPKRVTFNFRGASSPYLPDPVAYSIDEALERVRRWFGETESRYQMLSERGLQNIAELPPNQRPPRVIVIFDEFADLMADKEAAKALEVPLKRISAKARAAGIHLVLATQRPEASVVTPLLRSNLPGRVCLKVAGEADSKMVLNDPHAAYLLGRGDLLWQRGGGLLRLQSPFVPESEFERVMRVGS